MSQLLLTKGRIVQKLKTREALISKANEMLKAGSFTGIGAVAKAAGISKATAYRYFSDSEALKREASLQLKAKTSEDLFSDLPETDLAARLDRLITYHFELFTQNEAEFRLFLGSVIHESVTNKKAPSRGGRRIALIEEALKPLRPKLDAQRWDHMVNSLSVFFGIESVTVLKDVCGLANQDILATWKWAVERIVYGELRRGDIRGEGGGGK
jgi:AcrR family transcriptional regulator